MPSKLRVLVADDIELVAKVFRGDEVVTAALRCRPDIALLDVDMPGATGIEATAALQRVLPECRVMLLTSLPGRGHIPAALEAGASGYVVKAMSADELISSVRAVAAGHTVIDPQLAADVIRPGFDGAWF